MSDTEESSRRIRPIRSYVLREGRMTAAQTRAMRELWPRYGLELPVGTLDLARLFGRRSARTLEIGFGRGDVLLEMASAEPDVDFLGVEVHRPGIGHLLNGVAERGLTNVRVIRADAAELVRASIAPGSFDRILILFPDPWPKKRHRKRRLIDAPFVDALARALRPGGLLAIATDSQGYADQIRGDAGRNELFEKSDEPMARTIPTKYERRAARHGNRVIELAYRKRES